MPEWGRPAHQRPPVGSQCLHIIAALLLDKRRGRLARHAPTIPPRHLTRAMTTTLMIRAPHCSVSLLAILGVHGLARDDASIAGRAELYAFDGRARRFRFHISPLRRDYAPMRVRRATRIWRTMRRQKSRLDYDFIGHRCWPDASGLASVNCRLADVIRSPPYAGCRFITARALSVDHVYSMTIRGCRRHRRLAQRDSPEISRAAMISLRRER